MVEWLSHISLSFSRSGNPNCFVNVLSPQPWVCTDGGTLTFLLANYPSLVELSPGLVSFFPANTTSRAALHCVIPGRLRETGTKTALNARADNAIIKRAIPLQYDNLLMIICNILPFIK